MLAAPSDADPSPIKSEGSGSSSRIVPVASSSPIAAFTALLRVTVKVSSASSSASSFVSTVIVREVCPAGNVSVPVAVS